MPKVVPVVPLAVPAYAPARGCDMQMNAWCDANCAHHAKFGSLYARFDQKHRSDIKGLPPHVEAWRCYARTTLDATLEKYHSGKAYCTRDDELKKLQHRLLKRGACDSSRSVAADATAVVAASPSSQREGALAAAFRWIKSRVGGKKTSHDSAIPQSRVGVKKTSGSASYGSATWNATPQQQWPSVVARGHGKIIGVGLGLTGTSSIADALMSVGVRVAHNAGDQLRQPGCDAILNTLEDEYERLDQMYPEAKWLVYCSNNATAWLASVQEFLSRHPERKLTHLPVSFFGGACALPTAVQGEARTLFRIDPTRHVVHADDEPALVEAYRAYYRRLFAFLQLRGKSYTLVDLRANFFLNLSYIHWKLTPGHFGVRDPARQNSTEKGAGHHSSTNCQIDKQQRHWVKLRAPVASCSAGQNATLCTSLDLSNSQWWCRGNYNGTTARLRHKHPHSHESTAAASWNFPALASPPRCLTPYPIRVAFVGDKHDLRSWPSYERGGGYVGSETYWSSGLHYALRLLNISVDFHRTQPLINSPKLLGGPIERSLRSDVVELKRVAATRHYHRFIMAGYPAARFPHLLAALEPRVMCRTRVFGCLPPSTEKSRPRAGFLLGKNCDVLKRHPEVVQALLAHNFELHSVAQCAHLGGVWNASVSASEWGNASKRPSATGVIVTHGLMPPSGFARVLRGMAFLVGVGAVAVTPSPLEAIANGAAFLNPRDRGHSQHPLLASLGAPYVYNYEIGDRYSVVAAAERAVRARFASYTPRAHRLETTLAAVCANLIDHDAPCACVEAQEAADKAYPACRRAVPPHTLSHITTSSDDGTKLAGADNEPGGSTSLEDDGAPRRPSRNADGLSAKDQLLQPLVELLGLAAASRNGPSERTGITGASRPNGPSAKERLQQLRDLLGADLVSKAEYENKRAAIISSL